MQSRFKPTLQITFIYIYHFHFNTWVKNVMIQKNSRLCGNTVKGITWFKARVLSFDKAPT